MNTRGRSLLAGSLIAVVAAFVGCAVGSASSSNRPSSAVSAPASTVTHTETVFVDVPVPDTSKAPAPSGPQSTIGEGTWSVGDEIVAGTYKTDGPLEGVIKYCSFSIKKGEQYVDVGNTNNGPARMSLAKGQTVETHGCQTWRKV